MERLRLLITFLLLEIMPDYSTTRRYTRALKWVIGLTLWFCASVAVFGQAYPWAPVDITYHVNTGATYGAHNFDVPLAPSYGYPSMFWAPTGIHGHDHIYWMQYDTPTDSIWYEIRVDNINVALPNGLSGLQVMIFQPNGYTSNLLNPTFLYATGPDAVPAGQGVSLFVKLTGPAIIAVDGFGVAQGKFDVRVRRSIDSNGSLVSHLWPDGQAWTQVVVQ